MVLEKLSKLELEAIKTIAKEENKIETIHSIKKLLDQIDFSAEVIPFENSKKVEELFISLKGKQLSKCESKLVEELISK